MQCNRRKSIVAQAEASSKEKQQQQQANVIVDDVES